ncbi:hypothetical protein EC587_03100 [Klebsiella quasipneumoniae subsp. quasipneumoniae]|nr:hypothetical protein [Klebsiella quasipneumoniae]QER53785.1 hypothetical protein F2980_11860 [Klebsiella quasipneumoniae subsp. quasipneumoniae]TPB74393.1 hypothetical protein EC587_03100 [Klebsiella quasipneumoniae subsp. quasipneumoniae]
MGEIIVLLTAITSYLMHKIIHNSDERTEIKHSFFFCRLWYTARPSHSDRRNSAASKRGYR